MKASIKKYRRFTEGFKKSIVREYESGDYSVCELEKLYSISNQSIYNWIYKYSSYNARGYRVIEMKESSTGKVRDLEKRIADLERMVGQKQIQIDYLEKMMAMAKQDLNIDIKKNYDTPQSTGSDKTKTK